MAGEDLIEDALGELWMRSQGVDFPQAVEIAAAVRAIANNLPTPTRPLVLVQPRNDNAPR